MSSATKNIKQWHEYVDVMYYINLDHREDRRNEFLEEMERMNVPSDKIVRIPAVYKPKQGDWGCSLSHINTLEVFKMSGHKNCIIFEDDFTFVRNLDQINTVFQELFESDISFDICMLSYNIFPDYLIETTYHFLMKAIRASQTTSGYMITQEFTDKLLSNYIESASLIEKSYEFGKSYEIQHFFCIDQYWNKVIEDSNWYLITDRIGVQRKSYSDIEEEIADYGI
jgi:hypothetical protein